MDIATPSPDLVAPRLPATLRLGAVHLTVTDLDRSIAFYRAAVGLAVHRRDGDTAALGAGGEDLVVLVERPSARPAGRHAGLFHVALLHDSREELARAIVRLAATRMPISGVSDHGVSEAVYLRDPDGIGIEMYADRPRDQWPPPEMPGDRIGIYTRPLDLDPLLALVAGEEPRAEAGPGLTVGHVHLTVNDVAAARRFYDEGLGIDTQTDMGSAAFLGAGGYHHHLGLNVWRGEGIPDAPDPDTVVGLRHWTVLADGVDDVVLRDPAGIAVHITTPERTGA